MTGPKCTRRVQIVHGALKADLTRPNIHVYFSRFENIIIHFGRVQNNKY